MGMLVLGFAGHAAFLATITEGMDMVCLPCRADNWLVWSCSGSCFCRAGSLLRPQSQRNRHVLLALICEHEAQSKQLEGDVLEAADPACSARHSQGTSSRWVSSTAPGEVLC